jgi:hypothetical protein
MTLVRYERTGGRRPGDDESLEIEEGGDYTARRTVAGTRVGRFGGTLPASTLRGLGASVREVAAGSDLMIATPRDGATERIEVEGRTAELGSNELPGAPWRDLVRKLRRLLDGKVLASPIAALELTAAAAGVRIAHIGSEPVAVDTGSVAVQLVRLAPTGVPLERGSAGATGETATRGTRAWVEAGPGWTLDLPIPPMPLAAGESLQVLVTLLVRDGEDVRLVRLFAVAGAETR